MYDLTDYMYGWDDENEFHKTGYTVDELAYEYVDMLNTYYESELQRLSERSSGQMRSNVSCIDIAPSSIGIMDFDTGKAVEHDVILEHVNPESKTIKTFQALYAICDLWNAEVFETEEEDELKKKLNVHLRREGFQPIKILQDVNKTEEASAYVVLAVTDCTEKPILCGVSTSKHKAQEIASEHAATAKKPLNLLKDSTLYIISKILVEDLKTKYSLCRYELKWTSTRHMLENAWDSTISSV